MSMLELQVESFSLSINKIIGSKLRTNLIIRRLQSQLNLKINYNQQMGNQLCGKDEKLSYSIQRYEYSLDNQIFNKNIPKQHQEIIKSINLPTWKQKDNQKYFSGNFQNGRAQGFGVIYIPNHMLYQGNLHLGFPHGQGKINFMNRSQSYQGNFQNGMAHGRGKYHKYTQKNGFYFNGQWKNSEPLRGLLTPINNQQVQSIQMQNFQNGNGIIKFKNGGCYTGKLNTQFEPHGEGTFKYSNQSKLQFYSGQWRRGKYHGSGNCKWKDGSSYNGQYVEGQKQGKGIYKDELGNFYQGFWSGGKQQGEGVIVLNGIQKKAMWTSGQPKIWIEKNQNKLFDCERLPHVSESDRKLVEDHFVKNS